MPPAPITVGIDGGYLRHWEHKRNGHLIPNYAARRQTGQAISTAFVESLVNSLLSKRFAKKQSMQ